MTAEPDLLPELVDEGLDFFNLAGDEGDKLYVSAIRQHITAKDAEIEALRAEVERLAEALREAREMVENWAGYASKYFQDKHDLQGDLAKLDAALRDHDQEDRND